MSGKPPASAIRFMVGILLGAAVAAIGIAAWMMFNHKGGPVVLVAVAGSMLAALAAIISSQAKTKS